MVDTISIMSCDRDPSYLSKTVESIPEFFNIEVFYQGDPSDIQSDRYKIIQVDRPYTDVQRNAQYNYSYILKNSKNSFIIEDDVNFSQTFLQDFQLVLSELQPFSKYAVAIYSCYTWTKNTNNHIRLTNYPLRDFYGTQAMLYDHETSKNFGEFLYNNIGLEPYDMALKSYINLFDKEVKLLASTRSLVQHIGEQTTGLGFFHQSATYNRS